jgi:hypothetical protein
MGEGTDSQLRTSVAMLFSNLVTRPTGQAVRVAIEQQIQEGPGPCVSILDFSQVGVIDFSCADEIIAKLLDKYQREDRPSEAYFVLQGVSEHHREPIETVLRRHSLLLVAVESGRPELWGPAPEYLRMAWDWLDRSGQAMTGDFASEQGLDEKTANSWLNVLVSSRVAVPEGDERYVSLVSMLARGAPGEQPTSVEIRPYGAPGMPS